MGLYLTIEQPQKLPKLPIRNFNSQTFYILGTEPGYDFLLLEAASPAINALVELRYKRNKHVWPKFAEPLEYEGLLVKFEDELHGITEQGRNEEIVDEQNFPAKLYEMVEIVYQGLQRAKALDANVNIWINDVMRDDYKRRVERRVKFRESLKTWKIVNGRYVDLTTLQT